MAANEEPLYEEAGRVHRVMRGGRHAGVVGYFAVLYAAVSLAFKDGELVNRWILLAAAPIGLAFLAADLRTRALYYAATKAAAQFEPQPPKESVPGEAPVQGVYTRLMEAKLGSVCSWGPHTVAIAVIFGGYSALLAWSGWPW